MKTLRLHGKFIIATMLVAYVCWCSPLLLQSSAQSQNKQGKGREPNAQPNQTNQDAAAVRIDTELVQIDVVVADKQGKLVSDLKREDFQILEDGKPQIISHFSVGASGRQA